MTQPTALRLAFLALLLAAYGISTGCTREEVVFRERPFFDDPPPGAAGFLGYSEQATKLTVCGNCHVGMQSEWEFTAHADAWETLQASGHAQAFCEGCHTVNARGNAATGEGGWTATGDERYHDVQCEGCHGPGETHVRNPVKGQMLASLAVGIDLTTGCAECHQGNHHPFVEEWSQSKHAGVIGFAAARPECQACHRGQGTLRAWGVRANFVEKESADHLPLTCGVCHDPHDATNEGQLRFPVVTTSIEEHLCARCHDRRTAPDPGSAQGLAPHAPEAALLVGDAGWFPPRAEIDQGQIRGTHGSERNEALCATCHVNSFEITDQETGQFLFNSTGHLFTAIPCLDAEGIPTPGDCALSTTARSFNGCTAGGCHGDAQAAFSALSTASTRIRDRANTLLDLLLQVDPNLDGPGGEIDASNPTFTVAEGAFFNLNLANFGGTRGEPATQKTVAGSTTHNPFLVEALLVASIAAVEEEYGVSAGASVDWRLELDGILRRAGQ